MEQRTVISYSTGLFFRRIVERLVSCLSYQTLSRAHTILNICSSGSEEIVIALMCLKFGTSGSLQKYYFKVDIEKEMCNFLTVFNLRI